MTLKATASTIWALKIGVFLSLLAGLVAISQSSLMAADELIPAALAFDFLITLPAVYFLLVRKTVVPRATVIPVFFGCFLIASSVGPGDLTFMTLAAVVLIPAVELAALGYIGFRIFRTRKAYLGEQADGSDLMERLRNAFKRELKPAALARAAAFEIAIFVYALAVWRKKSEAGFTYHRQNSPILILSLFLFLIVVETVALHLLLALWSETLAWIATAFSIYFAVQIFAHIKALRLRPIIVTETEVRLRCGMLSDGVIPREAIESAERIMQVKDTEDGIDLLPVGGMSQPNIRLSLLEPITIFGVYGLKRRGRLVRLCVDEPAAFVAALKTMRGHNDASQSPSPPPPNVDHLADEARG
ncbi:MAG TPA: hypothetical protein VFZ49_04235 [Pyrinomonadaceae bacterium]